MPTADGGHSSAREQRSRAKGWRCYDACGNICSNRAALVRHVKMLHHDETKRDGSAAREVAIACGQTFCANCNKMGLAKKNGTMKAHECKGDDEVDEDAGEARDASKTPKRGKRRLSGDKFEPPRKSRVTRRTLTTRTSSAGSAASTYTTRTGRTSKAAPRMGDSSGDEAPVTPPNFDAAAESQPQPQVQPVVEIVEAEPTRPSFKHRSAWSVFTMNNFSVLNEALDNGDHRATPDAASALTTLLVNSWPATREDWRAKPLTMDEEEAETMKANDADTRKNDPSWDALRNLHRGFISRATASCSSNGFANLGLPAARAALRNKYPERGNEDTASIRDMMQDWSARTDVPEPFEEAEIARVITAKRRGSGKDDYGWGPDELKCLAKRAGNYGFIVPLINAIARGRFNHDEAVTKMLTGLRGVALAKARGDSTKVRPIGIGVVFTAIAGSLINRRNTAALKELSGPHQLAVGVGGGTDAAGRILIAALDRNAECVAWQDGENAYGSVRRTEVLKEFGKIGGVVPFAALRYGMDPLVTFAANGNKALSLKQEEGAIQGCAIAMAGYCAAQSTALAPELDKLEDREPDDKITYCAYADDRGYGGKIGTIIETAKEHAEVLVEKTGVRSGALHVFAPKASDDDRAALLAAGAVIETDGTVFVGTPIGSDEFVREWTMKKADEIDKLLSFAEDVNAKDDFSGAQLVADWLRKVTGPTFNHVLRNVEPRLVRDAARQVDDAVVNTVLRLAGLHNEFADSSEEEQALARALIHLPVSNGGLGFHSQVILAEAAYIGAWAQVLHIVVAKFELPKPELGDDLPRFLDAYAEAVEAVRPRIKAELWNKLDPRKFWDAPLASIQTEVAAGLHEDMRKAVVERLPTGNSLGERAVRILALAQNSREASAWVTANPLIASTKMSNDVFKLAVRQRLLLPVHEHKAQGCAKCAAPLDVHGTHAACCPALERSNRHKQIQEAVVAEVKPVTTFFARAPCVETYFPKKPEAEGDLVDDTKSMADIGITLKNTNAETPILVDFTVVAVVKGAPADYESAGAAACAAESAKTAKYLKRYAIPDGKFVGFGVETTGALGAQAKAFLQSVAAAAGGSPRLIAQRYRNITAALAVALKKALCNIEKRYLALCVNVLAED